ncbi:MAG: VCBS repeat-containing protein [Acidobacteriales bacterium]|nr:VCBS repeat-containing protein [Terriglobales bacterium]
MSHSLRTFPVVVAAAVALLASPLPSRATGQLKARTTNPQTARRLEEMRRGIAPAAPPAHFGVSASAPNPLPPVLARWGAALPASRAHSAAPVCRSFQPFIAAPYVSASAGGDASPVYTSVTANFDLKNGPDVAAVQVDGTLNVLLNNGRGELSGTYSNSSATALQPVIAYIESADLNHDGAPDIVTMDAANSAFLVFLNQKDGTFADAVSTSVTPASGASFLNGGSITVADVNGDGKPDVIAVANLQTGQDPDYTTIFSQQTFLGKGDGTFQTPQTVDTELHGYYFIQYGEGLGIADTNNDGNPDVVALIEEFDSKLATFLGRSVGAGNGSFQTLQATAARVEVDEPPQSTLKLADLNHDQVQDALFITRDGAVHVALGNADGTFRPASAALSNLISASLLALGDFDHDGQLDLVVYGYGVAGIFAGRADGAFDPAARGQYVGSLGGDQQPAPADFNADGNIDFLWVESAYNKLSIYLNKKSGSFPAATAIVPANRSTNYPNATEWAYNNLTAGVGDFNADGKTDVLTYDFTNAAASGFADIDFGISNGQGKFLYKVALPGGQWVPTTLCQPCRKRPTSITMAAPTWPSARTTA